jgi:hypothetical protein
LYNTFSLSFFLQEFFVERFGSDIRSVGPWDRSAIDKSFSEKARLFEWREHRAFLRVLCKIDLTMQPIVEYRRFVIASPDLPGRGDPSLLISLIPDKSGLPRRYAPRNDGVKINADVRYPDLP